MKKYLLSITLATLFLSITSFTTVLSIAHDAKMYISTESKLDIKLKNDTEDEISIINDGSGGTYRLTKNVVTTIKMEAGDKLYTYIKGKKGKLLLTASVEMNGKVQLMSKL